jgi:hypothetical protein
MQQSLCTEIERMADTFVTVMTFHQSFEAQLAKNLLDNEGIASVLSGEQMSDLQFGNVAMGDQIVLQVDEDDAQRAAGLLAAVAAAKLDDNWEEQAEADVWTCSICGEPIGNRLSICYSCQTPRESIRAAAPRESIAVQPQPTPPTGQEVQKRDEITETPSAEPPPPAPLPEPMMPAEMETDIQLSPTAANDDLARRAFLASIMGAASVFLLPLSWYYLFRVLFASGEMSTKGLRYMYGAWLVNMLFVLVVFILCAGGFI